MVNVTCIPPERFPFLASIPATPKHTLNLHQDESNRKMASRVKRTKVGRACGRCRRQKLRVSLFAKYVRTGP